MDDNNTDDLDTPLWGVEAIAPVVNRSERATYHLLNKKQLPAKKVGGKWVSTKRQLLMHLVGEAA